MIVDIYAEGAGPLSYVKLTAKVPIFEYAIICDVVVTQDKAVKSGRSTKPAVKITKQ